MCILRQISLNAVEIREMKTPRVDAVTPRYIRVAHKALIAKLGDLRENLI